VPKHRGDDQLARRAFDCIAAMKRAESIDDLSGTVAPMFDAIGLPHFAISRFFNADRRPNVSVIAGRFHSGWSQRYTSANYVRHSVIAHELLRTRQPYSWDEVMRTREVDEAQKRIKEEARENGLGDGLFTPVRWLDGSHAAVVLGGASPELGDTLIRTSAEVLSAYYASESRRLLEPGEGRSLTPRQRECLAWVRQGKSSSAIAGILGLSVETVNEHLGEACRRLGVRTRVQAAVEASLAGLID
jgi:LuxR family transcriptional regulator, quorum-sensing system regulator CciR